MRVIAGEARGVPLVAPAGRATRPTSDRLKGAIFSVLGDLACEGQVLDLFAGSGALGIEALSRGADHCDFVDSSVAACRAIEANLRKTGLEARGRVYCLPVERFIARRPNAPDHPYDLILLDPPYAWPGLAPLLHALAASPLVSAQTALLVEHSSRITLPPVLGQLELAKTRTHGDGAFSLYLAPDRSGEKLTQSASIRMLPGQLGPTVSPPEWPEAVQRETRVRGKPLTLTQRGLSRLRPG